MSPTDDWTLRLPRDRNGTHAPNGHETQPQLPAVVESRLDQMRTAAKAERQQMLTEAVRTAAANVLEGIHAPALGEMVNLVTADQKARQAEQTKLAQKLEAIEARTARASWIVASLSMTLALASLAALVFQLNQPKTQPQQQPIQAAQLMTLEQGKELAKQREELAKVVATLDAKKADLAAIDQQLADTRKASTEAATALQVIAESRKQAQADLATLEELKQKHRGSLMPGDNGKMYGEVSESATPFQYQGRWYVELKSR